MHATIKELPHSLQVALKRVEYNKADIPIEVKSVVDISGMSGDGMRCYYAIVALDGSVPTQVQFGSWGGANMFETKRPDVDHREHTMLPGVAVITGTSGGRGNFARITFHPDNIAAMLPPKPGVTSEQKEVLKSYAHLKPAYRPKYSAETISELVSLGLLKQNKAGATQITTAGKNAIS